MVPVAVRPAYLHCSQQTRPVKKLCPSLLLVLRGSRAPSTFLSCGTRLPCSLVDAVLLPSALSIHNRAHSGLVDNSNNTPKYWPEPSSRPAHFQLLLPSPRRHRQRHRHRNCVLLLLLLLLRCARCLSCCKFPGLPRLQRWTVIFLRSNRRPGCLCPFPLLSALSACPLLVRLPCLRSPPL